MGKSKQAPTTAEELRDCEAFERLRNSYHMTQEQWAQAIGVSYGLVKRIEAHTIKCSSKTKAKVHSFEVRYNSNQDAPDLHGLEAHIIYDVLLSHMGQTPKKDAAVCSARCTKALQAILSKADKFESADTQKTFFQFMEQVFTMLSVATDDIIVRINEGEDILNFYNGLRSVFSNKQIVHFKHSDGVMVSKDGEVTWQNNFFDFD